jgi:hypothetical protein
MEGVKVLSCMLTSDCTGHVSCDLYVYIKDVYVAVTTVVESSAVAIM